jgi:hypothetical protein
MQQGQVIWDGNAAHQPRQPMQHITVHCTEATQQQQGSVAARRHDMHLRQLSVCGGTAQRIGNAMQHAN